MATQAEQLKLMGHKVRDRISGFEGTVTGMSFFLTGCTQACVVPRATDPTKSPDGAWYDHQRLEILPGSEAVELDNGDTPGCDAILPASR